MRLVPTLLALLLAAPLGARAQAAPVVLELFTSQGCSSCPPADALLTEMAGRDGVIALALHVDYWDYLGWKDAFGKASNTKRQRAYAKAVGGRSVFTPEVVVQGEERLKGHDAARIDRAIARRQDAPALAVLSLERDGDGLAIRLEPTGAGEPGPSEVYLVRFIPSKDVSIEGGENAGRNITYTNIVTDWETIAHWDGTGPVDLRREGVGDEPLAVIVQRTHMGPVITAAELR